MFGRINPRLPGYQATTATRSVTVPGTAYTVTSADNGTVLSFTNGSAIAVTIPAGLGARFSCEIIQSGAGQITFTGSGATVNAFNSCNKTMGQHAEAVLVATAPDVLNLGGNITP